MDARRLLKAASLAGSAALLSGCAAAREPATAAVAPPHADIPASAPATPQPAAASMEPIPNPPEPAARGRTSRSLAGEPPVASLPPRSPAKPDLTSGRGAIATANALARQASRADAFVGGVQIFSYDPGRIYEVWTAPLRVTTLTLAPGETIVSKAAGDTVRWQIGETVSGQGSTQRAHVMVKPLERGLETNLVLATSQRIYLIQLKSGAPATLNTSVAWDLGAVLPPPSATGGAVVAAQPLADPAGPLDARYRIEIRGRRPAWTPTAAMTDGVRTYLVFPQDLGSHEAPALFVVAAGGDVQLVNYRQQGGLWVVDRVFDQAELRAGEKRPRIVRIIREGGRR